MAIPFLPRRDDETDGQEGNDPAAPVPALSLDPTADAVAAGADATATPLEEEHVPAAAALDENAGPVLDAQDAGDAEAPAPAIGQPTAVAAAPSPPLAHPDDPADDPDDESTGRPVDMSTAAAATPADARVADARRAPIEAEVDRPVVSAPEPPDAQLNSLDPEPLAAGPVQAVGSAAAPPEEVVPPLGDDHAGTLLGHRDRDTLRPGGGQQVARPARVIALANQKGGVGKTTTTINLGAALAELGSRVLLIDIDPQGSLGVGLGADPHSLERTVYNLLLVDGTSVDDVLIETNVENLHLLPANIDLAAAELLLVQEVAREQALRRVIERVQYRYDFILIDCPPSLGLLTINGLTAAEAIIVPLEAEYFALRGMSLLMQTLEKVQARLNPRLRLEGIVATMFDGRTLHAREVLERVRAAFGDTVFKTTINKTIRFAEAPVAGEPILTYRPRSKGSDAYRDLAREVLAREPSS